MKPVMMAALMASVAAFGETNTAASALAPALSSRMFTLTYADASEVAANFNRTWRGWRGPGWEVNDVAVPFVNDNAVMVTATPAILADCEKMIAQADRPIKQVYIEARFVELSNSALYNLGIDWAALNDLTLTGDLGVGFAQQNIPRNLRAFSDQTDKNAQYYSFDTSKGRKADSSYFQGTLTLSQMQLVLAAYEASKDAKTFSNPKVIVSSGRKAVVDMTTKTPNIVLSSKRVVKSAENTLDIDMKLGEIPGQDKLMFAKEAFFSWGISLEVTPRVTTNGIINIKIVPTLSEKSDTVTPIVGADQPATVAYPVIDVQRIVTEFNMKSGMTAVIGGLSKTEEEDIDSGIPYLCDIPWIGYKFFGGKLRQKVQKDVLVFVTVGECDPANMKQDTGVPKNAVLGRGYANGLRQEPGDRTNAVEGVMSLDLRSLEDRAAEKAPQQK